MNINYQELLKKKLSEQELYNLLLNSTRLHDKTMYVGRILERTAQQVPSRDALIFKDRHVCYKELFERTSAFSKRLQSHGVKKHDKVLVLIENSIEFYIAYYAVLQAGCVVAPLNTFLKDTELAHIIVDAQPALMITTPEFITKLSNAQLPPYLTTVDIAIDSPVDSKAHCAPIIDLEPDDMAVLLYTSGTTGFPKGVMLSSTNIMTSIVQAIARIGTGLQPDEKVFAVVPLFHSFAQNACVWGALFVGATVILVAKIERRLIQEAMKHQPTIMLGVPALYGLFCLMKTLDFSTVKYFVCGGDALSDKIRMAFGLVYQRRLCNGYGLSETSPTISVDLDDVLEPTSCIGKPLCGIECQIRDDVGTPVRRGLIGELWVKGDNVMLGYYNAPELTAATMQNGWFATGDLMYFNNNGKLVITGRIKDLIKSKGIKIYPQEIENVLLSHPQVIAAGVVGQADEQVGEVVIAFVQSRTGQNLEAELRELCKNHLAPYKIPNYFKISTTALPMTSTGKVDKKKLKAELKAG